MKAIKARWVAAAYDDLRKDHAVLVDNGRIVDVVPNAALADAIQAGIQALPEEGHRKLKQGERFTGVSPTQKQALQEGFGLAEMEQDGKGWNTKAGFAGYADESTATKKYPNGLPVPLLARAIESGSSVRQKHPFVRTAVNGARQDAVDAMERTVDEEIRKTMK